ncbi:2-oxoglutarate dehydrogenase E1 component [Candidatus Trichorickettsia mobilis]|uniref:2-oxoglutarate dehydrogenase E1 component n=1 Tax=Candidatus Trichorickettsia mobilis TaxID=1346319 RepID=A0ABZ0UWT3_9RICK|nr:2-oxoglutarate dehydrogenase E1 component [Candidatus Trichorickettsia mobilis]WPY01087.1 2-oxoglutarate dehydrogenase E1 component [Candidatus Trichorickettsia mobilis]
MTKDFTQTSLLFSGNAVFIEELYRIYLTNPTAVDSNWHSFFQSFQESNLSQSSVKTTAKVILPEEKKQDCQSSKKIIEAKSDNHFKIAAMIYAYRSRGHYLAKLDPLGMEKARTKAELNLNIEHFGFTTEELGNNLNIDKNVINYPDCTLKEFVDALDKIYCSTIAIEIGRLQNLSELQWLFTTIENSQLNSTITAQDKRSILNELIEVEGFEHYLHTKFPGAKRFSIEGGDSSVVALNQLINIVANCGVREVVIGMAHRGRLSTLTKVMHKPYRAVFSEFMGNSAFTLGMDVSGDVKYHMGYSSDHDINGNKIHLSLTPNPSHLEAVNPVVAGKVRAKQDLINDFERKKVLGVLIHGDAAFCGQGIVAECLAMSSLRPYTIGGIIHFVINNQVGFTANADDTRTGRYSTEIAKLIDAPILHVNGDDIEAVLRATYIATHYQRTFGKDVVIEIICYRKYGHNEGDEPMYTQSAMYNIIKNKQSPASYYAQSLIDQGIIDQGYADKLRAEFKTKLDLEYSLVKDYQPENKWVQGLWAGYVRTGAAPVATGVAIKQLQELGLKLCNIPTDFALNPKLEKLFEARVANLNNGTHIDWATAEQLAFASLLVEGIPIRLTGQDSGRGTFSHRHSVLHSQVDDTKYIPLNNLTATQSKYFVADSNLSEYGVLGFEYGYSLVNPKHLILWEAQFGDFCNGAQIIFDQFISSSETKWLQFSGLVVLLPHGFEGQGPEHSSARLERFLSLAAEENMIIAYPTTPASFFHLLRRQIVRNTRKPLIVMTPKSLLRHKLAVSKFVDMDTGTKFLPVLDEIDDAIKNGQIKRLIFCSGKVYYDLLERRSAKNIRDIAIIRLEQLYPFIEEDVVAILSRYTNVSEFIWCQEEPQNMGAWNYIQEYLNNSLRKAKIMHQFKYVGRKPASSPAVGYLSVHNQQQEELLSILG